MREVCGALNHSRKEEKSGGRGHETCMKVMRCGDWISGDEECWGVLARKRLKSVVLCCQC